MYTELPKHKAAASRNRKDLHRYRSQPQRAAARLIECPRRSFTVALGRFNVQTQRYVCYVMPSRADYRRFSSADYKGMGMLSTLSSYVKNGASSLAVIYSVALRETDRTKSIVKVSQSRINSHSARAFARTPTGSAEFPVDLAAQGPSPRGLNAARKLTGLRQNCWRKVVPSGHRKSPRLTQQKQRPHDSITFVQKKR